jgi:nucleoside-diphosphate-sugar epimerase
MKGLRVGVLGANGFLGSGLRNLSREKGIFIENVLENSNDNYMKIYQKESEKFDVLINCLMRMPKVESKFLASEEIRNSCFMLPKNIVENCLRDGGRVINTSTYLQLFNGKKFNPVGVYAEYKQEFSDFLALNSAKGKWEVLDLVFFTLYGPNDKPSRLIPSLIEAMRTNKVLPMTPGQQYINLYEVSDASETILNSINTKLDEEYGIYRCFGEEYLSIKTLVSLVEKLSDVKIDCKWGALEYSGVEMLQPWNFEIPEFEHLVRKTSLESGIEKLIKLALDEEKQT